MSTFLPIDATSQDMFLRFGERETFQVLVLPTLFHEGERTRSLAAGLMRHLARQSIGSTFVELQGLGESEDKLPISAEPWHERVRAAAALTGASHSISIRSGAVFDHIFESASRFRLTPVGGAAMVRDLLRAAAPTRTQADSAADRDNPEDALVRAAGYAIPSSLLDELRTLEPVAGAGRTARLAGDTRPADIRVPGPLLWRQNEPEPADAFAASLAADIADWLLR